MLFKVFIDTNIYDRANYSFRNALFQEIRNRAAKDEVWLVINEVIEGEVKSHISDRVSKAVEKINKALNDSAFAGIKKLSQYDEEFAPKNTQKIVEANLHEFESFLSDCRTERLSVDNISVSKILQDYFEQNLPFEEKKPDEFKDAIAIESLLIDMHKELDLSQRADTGFDMFQYCVVSNDLGFCGAVRNGLLEQELQSVKFFSELLQFVDYLSRIDNQSQYLKRYLYSEYGRELLEDTIKKAINSTEIEIMLDGSEFVEEQDIIETDISEVKVYVLGIDEFEDAPASAKVVVKAHAQIKMWYEYFNGANSYWDREEHRYLWKETGEAEAVYQIEPEIVLSLDISGCAAPEDWDSNQEIDFQENEVKFIDYIEIPDRIDCSEDNLVEIEVLEHSDPFHEYEENGEVYRDVAITTCPDCGCPIGFRNDGGNGFCINCAPNH